MQGRDVLKRTKNGRLKVSKDSVLEDEDEEE